jgi:hypothetical protein
VPPDGTAVRSTEPPVTPDGEAGDIVADSVGLTRNWAGDEVAVTGTGAESVTVAQ